MIKTAVFSYSNNLESFGNKSGFARYSDFLFTTAVSMNCASQYFPEVQFFSTDWGVDLMKSLGMPVTTYSNKLNKVKHISPFFWAYGKLIAYSEQKKPFVHIDNDVFLSEPLPDKILNARLCFQSHEPFNLPGYQYYEMLRPCFDQAPIKPRIIQDNPITDFAFNCGICGGHDLAFFKEWIKCSKKYILAPENQDLFFKTFDTVLIHQNLFHEQYFAASLIKAHNLRDQVEVLDPDVTQVTVKYKYTHLWGTTKKDKGRMALVKWRLYEDNKKLFERIYTFCVKNNLPWR